ncbi:uncharacterized protein LAESUDRAFT_715256 [Laetiporus sulphureus 93-53]|uniref:Uncharacterized protein n=1 Tax=Laetiporus sulphureus 93-53 TaxID=1314785 RepID=A0A165DIK8_9APHY|nr:uncharacterized protein LAESUDRAFT_715256 [Laetiporus sulphureus 93-53]KZT04960.1 hypothetical protein LAESUDRAFT_715256 [Laetiporus sulphureus 93-53]
MPARSSTKIIIKPRKARVSVPQPMEEEEVVTSDTDNQKEEEEEPESPLASTSAQTPLAEDYDGVDVQTPEADDGGSHDGDSNRTVEASAEWQRLRKEALRACGGIMEGVPVVEERMNAEKRARGSEDVMEGAEESARARGKRRKIWDEGPLPLGVYEPHTGIVFYRSDTQPSRARWESLPDDADKRRVLGGTKAGSGAWGVAWVDTVVELPREEEIDFEGRIARAPFLHTTSEPS